VSAAHVPSWVPAPQKSPYAQLCYDWGDAYQIERTADGVRAGRRDGGGWITAKTVEELEELIRADYNARPVPRDVAP
jgi:hypothetical protein